MRAPEGGQSELRDDKATGTLALRDTLERHLRPSDLDPSKRGPRGALGRLRQKLSRFSPGAPARLAHEADARYASALAAVDVDERTPPVGHGGEEQAS